MHPKPIGGVQDHPPVAQLVAEPFDHKRGVARHRAGGLSLVVEQLPQVVGRELVKTHRTATLRELLAAQARQLAGESADGRTQFGRPAYAVPLPERQPRGLARRRDHQHPVVGDLGDAPTGRTQRDHVAGPGLVDHLLVEFAYPRRLFGVGGQIDGEQAAVRNRAAGGHRQPLRARARRQRACIPVVHQPRPQLGELGGRVLAGQQVQRCLKCAARQRRERRAATHRVEPAVGVQRLQRARRHRVLGQHVERVRRHTHGLDLAGQHPLHGYRAPDQVGAVLGKQHTLGDLADLMTGAADALQAAGHRRRRLDLDHQIDRPHVDAQFQAGSRDDGAQASALEVVLDQRALLLADGAVMRAGQQRSAPKDWPLAISCAGEPPPT